MDTAEHCAKEDNGHRRNTERTMDTGEHWAQENNGHRRTMDTSTTKRIMNIFGHRRNTERTMYTGEQWRKQWTHMKNGCVRTISMLERHSLWNSFMFLINQ